MPAVEWCVTQQCSCVRKRKRRQIGINPKCLTGQSTPTFLTIWQQPVITTYTLAGQQYKDMEGQDSACSSDEGTIKMGKGEGGGGVQQLAMLT